MKRKKKVEDEKEKERKKAAPTVVELDEEQPITDNTDISNENKTQIQEIEQDSNDNQRQILTTETYKQIAETIKSREICVLGIGKRWWDCERKTLTAMTALTESDVISKLILEYAGFSWGILQFPFPRLEENDDHFKGAMTEVLKSGFLGLNNYLLLGKMGKDPKTKMVLNHWIFFVTMIPSSFDQMWNVAVHNPQSLGVLVKVGALGSQDKKIP